jgi:hypothetical protein
MMFAAKIPASTSENDCNGPVLKNSRLKKKEKGGDERCQEETEVDRLEQALCPDDVWVTAPVIRDREVGTPGLVSGTDEAEAPV